MTSTLTTPRGDRVADDLYGERPEILDIERELEAITALIDLVGGSAVLRGHSSGGSIALAAVARGLSVAGLALWETPIAGDPVAARAFEFVHRDHRPRASDARGRRPSTR
ncbi:hypothetical protein ELQ90_09945 [Labedella phragmitis]|uniref:Alpha/beta hydrolase n=1 Tax=Labedella phragmitis TaxID=2498849 RepID=A0A444PTB4_9MICO|nr:hypothetical protein [Labedella phragmitis]RWZ51105.1 hypothetical protein ELQ90_09945 [Labedella phragmitis]